jgi:hypothetical protein
MKSDANGKLIKMRSGGQPAAQVSTPPSAGKITRVSVTYTVDTPDGPRHAIVGLSAMRRCARPARLAAVLDDLTIVVGDIITAGGGVADEQVTEHFRRQPFALAMQAERDASGTVGLISGGGDE